MTSEYAQMSEEWKEEGTDWAFVRSSRIKRRRIVAGLDNPISKCMQRDSDNEHSPQQYVHSQEPVQLTNRIRGKHLFKYYGGKKEGDNYVTNLRFVKPQQLKRKLVAELKKAHAHEQRRCGCFAPVDRRAPVSRGELFRTTSTTKRRNVGKDGRYRCHFYRYSFETEEEEELGCLVPPHSLTTNADSTVEHMQFLMRLNTKEIEIRNNDFIHTLKEKNTNMLKVVKYHVFIPVPPV